LGRSINKLSKISSVSTFGDVGEGRGFFKGDPLVTRLHTPKEISGLLQVSESTVLRMAYSGDLPYITLRAGKRKKIIRFDPVKVQGWLEKRAKMTG